MDTFWQLFKEGGIIVGMFVVIAFFFFTILKYFIDQGSTLMEALLKQQESFQAMNQNWQKIIDEHTAQAREFHTRSAEADRFQRDEHLKIMDGITTVIKTFIDEHNKRSRESIEILNGLKTICAQVEDCDKK